MVSEKSSSRQRRTGEPLPGRDRRRRGRRVCEAQLRSPGSRRPTRKVPILAIVLCALLAAAATAPNVSMGSTEVTRIRLVQFWSNFDAAIPQGPIFAV